MSHHYGENVSAHFSPATHCGEPAVTVRQRLWDGVPQLAVAFLLGVFAVDGTTRPWVDEWWWQIGAAVACVLCLMSVFVPRLRWVAGVVASGWLAARGAYTYGWIYPEKVNLYGVALYPTLLVLVAWSWGRSPRPARR